MRRTTGPSSALCRRITASCRAVTCRRGAWRDISAVWMWMISCTIRHWASWPSPSSMPVPSSPGSVSTGTNTTPAATPDTETRTKEPSTSTTSDMPGLLYFRYLLVTHFHCRAFKNSHPADWCSLCLMWTYWNQTSFPENCLKCFFFLQMMVCLGYYSGGLGGNHVLRHGCSLILQLHLLYSADYCKYTNPHKLTQIYESVLKEQYRVFYLACGWFILISPLVLQAYLIFYLFMDAFILDRCKQSYETKHVVFIQLNVGIP